MSEQATLSSIQNPVSIVGSPGKAVSLLASSTLSADYNDNISTVIGVGDANRVTLLVSHTPHASQSGGYPVLIALFANSYAKPAIGDDDWYAQSVLVAGTAGSLPGTIPTGADWRADPNWTPYEVQQRYWTFPVASASEAVRARLRLETEDAQWMYVAAIQQGDAVNFGAIKVDYTVSL